MITTEKHWSEWEHEYDTLLTTLNMSTMQHDLLFEDELQKIGCWYMELQEKYLNQVAICYKKGMNVETIKDDMTAILLRHNQQQFKFNEVGQVFVKRRKAILKSSINYRIVIAGEIIYEYITS